MKLKRKNTCDGSLGFRWFPNSWKLEQIESTPTNVSFERLFLNKVQPTQKNRKRIKCTTSSPGHLAFLILEDQVFQL